MADCEKYIMMISSLADCELSPDEEAELRTHMESCDNCRRIYETFKGISGAISDDLVKPPESLSKGIMYRIETQGKSKKPRFFAFGRFTGIAACLILILFGASKFGWFQTTSSPNSISEETSLSISDSAESEDVPETQIENSSDSSLSEEKGEDDKNRSNDDMMFTAPMTGNSSDNVTQSGGSLDELFASDEIKVFKGSVDTTDSTSSLIISDDNIQTELLDILGYSGIDITDPKLSDTPNYTLLFSNETELYLYFVDDSIYCKLKNCKTVYIATGTMDEFESLIEQTQSVN